MSDLHVVILAAGKGTRMKSVRPKVLHNVAGRPMVDYAMAAAQSLTPRTTTVVVGHMKELLRQGLERYPGLSFVTQEPQLGTGHALLQTADVLERETGFVLLLSGDVPLLKGHTLAALVRKHVESNVAATVLTAIVEQPYGYGRVVRTKGRISRIVEERDASPAQRKIREINSGVYVFSLGPLFDSLRGLATGNAQGEYDLTDSRLDLSPPPTRRRDGRRRRSERDSRHQQPVGTGRSEPNRETKEKRRADGRRRDNRRSRHDLCG